ncbi:MAG: PEP-CTERM sorting domain-containing protein [Fimbriimonadales bacterium]
MRRNLFAVALAVAISAIAHAGWNVTIVQSTGQLNPGTVTVNVPTTVITTPFPQVTFQTAAATPNPILVGDGTSFTSGSFNAIYTIDYNPGTGPNLTGFNFVIAGFVQGTASISWFKKVVRNSDNAIIYDRSGSINGSGFGGTDGSFSIVLNETLDVPANDVTVYETFQLFVTGAPGVPTAALLLVEQDWVPEPASMIALGTGLAGLLALRRRNRN